MGMVLVQVCSIFLKGLPILHVQLKRIMKIYNDPLLSIVAPRNMES